MQVYSYIGRRAASSKVTSADSTNFSPVSSKSAIPPVSPSRKSIQRTRTEARPLGAINGYSPVTATVFQEPRPIRQTARAKPVRTTRIEDSFEKEISRPQKNPTISAIQIAFSLVIFVIVPYVIFGFLNRQLDQTNLAPLLLENKLALNGSVSDFSVLNGIASDALDGEIAKLSQSLGANDTEFDENGNLVLADGTIISADSVNPGTPVEWATYTVQKGETIDAITYKFGLRNISTVIASNNIENVKRVWAGQKLRIPSQDGVPHYVASGESLNSISVKYHVSVEEILDANDLSTDTLTLGQELFIPGAKMDKQALRSAMGETFASPLPNGWRLTSHFGSRIDPISGVRRSHTGIDMAMSKGTTIKAAMGGKVIKATFSPIFGYYVVIDHGNGYQSLYGHMTKFVVKSGQYVNQGQKIGYVGSTGYSTGPHLHFTVYKNGKLVDPLPLIKQ